MTISWWSRTPQSARFACCNRGNAAAGVRGRAPAHGRVKAPRAAQEEPAGERTQVGRETDGGGDDRHRCSVQAATGRDRGGRGSRQPTNARRRVRRGENTRGPSRGSLGGLRDFERPASLGGGRNGQVTFNSVRNFRCVNQGPTPSPAHDCAGDGAALAPAPSRACGAPTLLQNWPRTGKPALGSPRRVAGSATFTRCAALNVQASWSPIRPGTARRSHKSESSERQKTGCLVWVEETKIPSQPPHRGGQPLLAIALPRSQPSIPQYGQQSPVLSP